MPDESRPSETEAPDLWELISRYVDLVASMERDELHKAMLSAFETVPGDARLCVRRLEVVDHVARARGIKAINNRLFADVERAARELGWEPVKNGGRSLFRCVKRKGHDLDEALRVSRANRSDPRFGQPSNGRSADADHASDPGGLSG